MSIDDSQFNKESKKLNITMPHMFQKSNQETFKPKILELDILSQHQSNLSKIVKSYRNDVTMSDKVKTESLVSQLKHLLEKDESDDIKSLYDYLDELKTRFIHKKTEFDKSNSIDEDILIEEAEDDNEVDIDHLLKTSEKEILNSTDQKSILKSLIDDINLNTSSKSYDDSQFERNINEIMNESIDEIDEEEDDLIEEIEEREVEEKTLEIDVDTKEVKKSKLTFILILIMIILLGIAGYLYKDMIYEIIQNL